MTQREPRLAADLSELLRGHFAPLFDTYMYYAKTDADENAAELYRMTEPGWKAMLRDALVLGGERCTPARANHAAPTEAPSAFSARCTH